MKTCARKICMVGTYGVGKTSLIQRFVHQTFSDKYLTTLGVKIDTKVVSLPTGDACKLVIWDIAGKEEFSTANRNYLKGSAGCLMVVDGTRSHSVASVLQLKEQTRNLTGDLPFVCAINKSDLEAEWDLEPAQLDTLAREFRWLFRTSALTGEQVETVFQQLAELVCPHA